MGVEDGCRTQAVHVLGAIGARDVPGCRTLCKDQTESGSEARIANTDEFERCSDKVQNRKSPDNYFSP
jgi:hypothetical protein